MRRLEPICLCPWGWGPFPCPPGAWYRGGINAGPAPINLVMFTQARLHGLMQLLPGTSGVPVAQVRPASHAAAVPKRLGKVYPWDACLQHEQDAVEGSFIVDCELARTASGIRHDGWDEGI